MKQDTYYLGSNAGHHARAILVRHHSAVDYIPAEGVSICVKVPSYIAAQDIIIRPSVEIVDTSQPIANLTERKKKTIYGWGLLLPSQRDQSLSLFNQPFIPNDGSVCENISWSTQR